MSYYLREALYALPFAVLGGALCLLIRRSGARRESPRREVLRALFVCYLVGLWALLLPPNNLLGDFWRLLLHGGRREGGLSYYAPALDPRTWRFSLSLRNLFGPEALANALLFLPLGVFLPLLRPRAGAFRVIATGALLSAAAEILQMPLRRSSDARDLVMNTLGVAAGCLLCRLAQELLDKRRTAR